jgi:hypothetical protein
MQHADSRKAIDINFPIKADPVQISACLHSLYRLHGFPFVCSAAEVDVLMNREFLLLLYTCLHLWYIQGSVYAQILEELQVLWLFIIVAILWFFFQVDYTYSGQLMQRTNVVVSMHLYLNLFYQLKIWNAYTSWIPSPSVVYPEVHVCSILWFLTVISALGFMTV